MTLNTTLEDARVWVVGASSGIGRALAEHALAQGARVSCAARRTELLNEIIAGHPKGVAITADIRNAEDCRRIVASNGSLWGLRSRPTLVPNTGARSSTPPCNGGWPRESCRR